MVEAAGKDAGPSSTLVPPMLDGGQRVSGMAQKNGQTPELSGLEFYPLAASVRQVLGQSHAPAATHAHDRAHLPHPCLAPIATGPPNVPVVSAYIPS